jgi:putative NADPH-quinone reductase
MADKDIVGGMFGITPEMYQQRADELAFAQAQRIGAAASGPGTMLSPSLAPFYTGAAQQGQMLSKGIGGLLGVEDQELSLVRQTSQLAQQIGVDTPEKLQTLAGELQKLPGGAALAVQAIEKANSMMKTGAEAQTAQQKIDQEKKLREELNTLGENATDDDILRIVRKYGTPDQVMRAVQSSADKKARLSATTGGRQEIVSNNGVKGGYVDAKGNFFNNQGRKVSAREFEDSQKSHDSASSLIYKLQNITEDDINNAYGSLIDYTTAPGGKLIGPTKTLEAQTKINEVGIRSVLNNLSQLKGASSDKEMTQMIKDFPGFQSEPSVMKKWVDRAVATTNNFLQKSEKRYGFDTDYGTEGRFAKPKQDTNTLPATAQQATIYAKNPQTNERIMSTDGGKTWNPVGGK